MRGKGRKGKRRKKEELESRDIARLSYGIYEKREGKKQRKKERKRKGGGRKREGRWEKKEREKWIKDVRKKRGICLEGLERERERCLVRKKIETAARQQAANDEV